MIDPNREKEKRRRNAFIVITLELVFASAGFGTGLRAYLLTSNSTAGAFWAHTALLLACIILYIGVGMRHEGRSWMVGGLILNAIGIILVACGAIADGVAAEDIRTTEFSRCHYSVAGGHVGCANFVSFISIFPPFKTCGFKVERRSCFCCYIYEETHCSGRRINRQFRFYDVDSCSEVSEDYHVYLWASMGVGIATFIISIVTSAMVSYYRSALKYGIVPYVPGGVDPLNMPNLYDTGPRIVYPTNVTKPPDYQEAIRHQPPPITHPPPAQPSNRYNGNDSSTEDEDNSRNRNRNKKPPPYSAY